MSVPSAAIDRGAVEAQSAERVGFRKGMPPAFWEMTVAEVSRAATEALRAADSGLHAVPVGVGP